jgi:hypothetical protein
MLREIALLAVDKLAYNEGLRHFQIGVSLTGASVLIGGIYVLFSKSYWFLGLILCMLGAVIVLYPWLAFSPIE